MTILRLLRPCLHTVLFGISGTLAAQNNMASAGSLTPDGASVARNINIPADLYTGRLNVQIPLYTIKSRNFSLPITLEYQTSGLKVEDLTSWVGKGWTLQCGGMVTRIVRGYPDETGYCDGDCEKIETALATNQKGMNHQFMDNWDKQKVDGEPDIFYFQIPGYSGIFVCDGNGTPHTIPEQSIKIEWVDKNYFRITDENGNIYTLGSGIMTQETSQYKLVTDNSYKEPYISTWHLEKIETVNHLPIVVFEYERSGEYTFRNTNNLYKFRMDETYNLTYEKLENKDVLYKISPRLLSNIIWETGSVGFNRGSTDYNESHSMLNNIFINESEFLYKINLTYFPYTLNLQSVSVVNGNKKMPVCSFVYNGTSMPNRTSYSVDHWGYYNGAPDSEDYPTFTYRGKTYTGKTHRNPNGSYSQAEILKKICYPAGGFIEFEYDNHSAYTRDGKDYKEIGGVRIAKVRQSAGDGSPDKITKYEYLTEDNKSSGTYNEHIHLFTGNLSYYKVTDEQLKPGLFFYSKNQYVQRDVGGTYVGYSRVKEIASDGSYKIHKYTSFMLDYDVPGQKAICNSQFWGFEPDDTGIVPTTTNFWKRGLKQAELQYSATGELIAATTYEYDYEFIPKTKIPAYPIFNEVNTWYLGRYYWYLGNAKLTKINQSGKYLPQTEVRMEYNDIGKVGKIEKIFPDSTKMTTLYLYPTDYFYFNAQLVDCPIPQMQLRNVIVPIEVLSLKNDKVVSGTIQDYKITDTNDTLRIHYNKTLHLNLLAPVPMYNSLERFMVSKLSQAGYLTYDSRYECTEIASEYDAKDNIVKMQRGPKGNYIYTQYDYKQSLPVAVVEVPCSQDNFQLHVETGIEKKGIVDDLKPTWSRTELFYYDSFESYPLPKEIGYSERAKTGRCVCRQDLTINTSRMAVGMYDLSYWYLDAGTWRQHRETVGINNTSRTFTIAASAARPIDEVRLIPQGASIRTANYRPGVGKISETDENGITTYYEYNTFGMLSAVYNNDYVLLERYDYDKFQNE